MERMVDHDRQVLIKQPPYSRSVLHYIHSLATQTNGSLVSLTTNEIILRAHTTYRCNMCNRLHALVVEEGQHMSELL